MSYIKPHNAIGNSEILHSPTEKAVYDALATKQPTGNYITQLTGEITASGPGSVSATISAQAVTNSKLALMVTGTIKGNNSGSPASPSDLNSTTVTSMLDVFSTGLKGLVPAPTISDAGNYLKGDGTWATISIPASANQYLSNLLSPTAINQVLLGLDGSALAPAYSFTNNSNLGMYRSGANTLNFSTSGTNRLQIESDGKIKIIGTSGANLLWNTDGGGDIGTLSSGGRPDSIYVKTNLNLASLTASSFVGSDTSKNLISLSAATATSYLNNFIGDGGSGGIKGLVPAPSSGDAAANKYLKADGTWAAAGGLPSQTGNADKMLVTDGSSASWVYPGLGANSDFPTNTVILGRGKPTGATAQNTVLIGVGSNAGAANDSVAIGYNAYANDRSVAIGSGASVPNSGSGYVSVSIGYSSTATGEAAVTIGSNATGSRNSTIIGYGTSDSGQGVVIGRDASSSSNSGAVVIGRGASAASSAIAIGYSANAGTSAASSALIIGYNSGKSTNSGASNTVVGSGSFNNASLTTAASNVVVGQGAATSLTTNSNSVIVGALANVTDTGSGNTVLGKSATASGNNGIAIGISASVASVFNGSIAIGNSAATTAENGIAIGQLASAAAASQISIGRYAGSVGSSGSGLFIGNYSVNRIGEGANICFFGGQAQNGGNINTVYFSQGGESITGASLLSFLMTVTPATGTNQSAATGTFTIAGAKGTGTGTGGDVIVSTSPAGTSGSTRNASVERLRVTADGNVTVSNAQLQVATVGYGLTVKSGSNAKIGTATFSGVSSVTVSTTAVTANSIIFVATQSGGYAPMCVNNIVAGTSFDIIHNNAFTGTVGWIIVEAI